MDIEEKYIDFEGYKTYVRIVNPKGKKTPLLFLHGGPGSTHNSFEVLDRFAFEDDRPFIMYDQLGCGLSFIDGNPSLWKKETWAKELINLREKLSLEKIHLLGHSWGGMLAIIYLCDYKSEGIQSVTLSSTLSSASLWREETHRLITFLPKEEREDIRKGEEKGDYTSLEFTSAMNDYYHHFVFGVFQKGKDPDCLTRPKKNGHEAYLAAWGPSEFNPLGTLRDYEYTDKLSTITCPVQLFSGANDESTPLQNKIMYEKLGSKYKNWFLFAKSRHMTYYEENDLYGAKLLSFLNREDK